MAELQCSTDLRDALNDLWESIVGTSAKLRYYTGSMPTSVAASATGTLLVEMTLPSDWMAASSSGSKAKSGTWSGTAVASGAPGYFRITTSGGTAKWQGTISSAFNLTTSATTSVGSNVLTFSAASGVTDGSQVAGTGIPSGATVLSHTSTTVTMSAPTTTGVASSAAVYFGDASGHLWHNGAISTSQVITVDVFTLIAPGA